MPPSRAAAGIKRVANEVRRAGARALATTLPKAEERRLKQLLTDFDVQAALLVDLLSGPGMQQTGLAEIALEAAWSAIGAAYIFGQMGSTLPEEQAVRERLLRELPAPGAQVAAAREAKQLKVKARHQGLREAILKAAKGAKLVTTRKFAQSLETEVQQILGSSKGASAATIQREIGRILTG